MTCVERGETPTRRQAARKFQLKSWNQKTDSPLKNKEQREIYKKWTSPCTIKMSQLPTRHRRPRVSGILCKNVRSLIMTFQCQQSMRSNNHSLKAEWINTLTNRLLANRFSNVATSSKQSDPTQATLNRKTAPLSIRHVLFTWFSSCPDCECFSHSHAFYGASERSCFDEKSKGFLSALGFVCLCLYLTHMFPGHGSCVLRNRLHFLFNLQNVNVM